MAKKKTKKVEAEVNHVMGRPTLYDPEMCNKVDEYIDKCIGKDVEEKRLPTKAGFALYLDVSKRVIADWSEKYPDFLQSLSKLMTTQEDALMNNGLNGTYNSTIAKLILSSNHGMCERKHIEGDMAINVIIDK